MTVESGLIDSLPRDATESAYRTYTEVMAQRYSCRGFRSQPVPRETIEQILEAAQHTASWCNTQPWHATILSGRRLRELADRMYERARSGAAEAFDLDTPTYQGTSLDRRRAAGWGLYDAVGIVKGDRAGSLAQAMENFRFFGAPHVAIITGDRALGTYGALDCGGYVTSFLTAATALGVATIAQAAAVSHGDIVRDHLQIPEDRVLICGISFGYADPAKPANKFRADRADIQQAATFLN